MEGRNGAGSAAATVYELDPLSDARWAALVAAHPLASVFQAPAWLSALIENVITRNPKTVRRDQLASETLEILNSAKVTALFVVEGSKPIGIVHIHDVLRAGVA